MKITIKVTDREVNLKQDKDGTYHYRINGDMKVEGFPNPEEAKLHAEENLVKLAKQIVRK